MAYDDACQCFARDENAQMAWSSSRVPCREFALRCHWRV
ncbi:hypothetical protein COLO4_34061 [Corchorus olitorius]|uniref:Uncharacterized protein n=1 Tax=Corchorus olitorius TaxID=93759 RepID=A0A1R3GP04_9ROSI|nr:hypothetical protein COLO4_34061 [Corchorus olitorius]